MANVNRQETRELGSRGDRGSGQHDDGQRRHERDRDGNYGRYHGGGGFNRGRGRGGRGNYYNRQNDYYENWHSKDDRGSYNKNSNYRNRGAPGGGFGTPSNNAQNDQGHEYYNRDNYDGNQRSRPRSKQSENHMRDASPDRNDRARPKDKSYEDHTRDTSPDRSSNEQYRQDGGNTQIQSEYNQNFPSYSEDQQGSRASNMHYNNSDFGGQWNQGYRNDRRDFDRNRGNRGYDPQGNDRRNYNRNRGNQDYDQQGQSGFQQSRRQTSWEENSDVRLSKALSFLLRHGAERQGYKLMSGGFLYVDEILKKQQNLRDFTLEDIQRIVKVNDKQRFHMEQDKETGKWKIRANQGHTVQVDDLDLKPVLSKEEAQIVIHGTYMTSWEKIKNTGLCRMGRNHIHFAAGEPGENGVISGMRSSCEVMIYIDMQKALQDGLKFFRSANNVILCAGNKDGVIPPTYFEAVVERNPRRRLDFDKDVKIQKIPVGGAGLEQGGKGKKKKKKKGKGDKEHEEGTESKSKKEKMEVDEDAVEGAANLYVEESMETDDKLEQAPVARDKLEQAPVAHVKSKWDDDDDEYHDAVQDDDEFQDAEDNSDVQVESSEETLLIDEASTSVSAVDFLAECDVVAVQCNVSGNAITEIVCVGQNKCFKFNPVSTPDIMTDGKLSDFFNFNKDTVKVFHGLDSQTCAIFFEKFNIILDGTKIFDLKAAYDLMKSKGSGNVLELKQTGYNPDLTPSDDSDLNSLCQTYLKGYTYLSKALQDDKDYKKELFQMVNKDIDRDALKKEKEWRKKELKGTKKDKGKKK